MSLETIIAGSLVLVDGAIVYAMLLGYHPFGKVLGQIWSRIWRFSLVFALTAIGLTIAIPWIDVTFYEYGITLPDDVMIFVAPTIVLVLSLTAGFAVVREISHRKEIK